MIEPVVVYKVVRQVGDQFVSLSASKDAAVTYQLGVYTVAPDWLSAAGYGLVAFKTKANVQTFLQSYFPVKIPLYVFRADALGWTDTLPVLLDNAQLADRSFAPDPITRTWPVGTVMANKIRLQQDITGMFI